jgi:hypothetical protein
MEGVRLRGTLGHPLLGENKVHPKYIMGEGGCQNYCYGCNPILLVTEGGIQNFKTLAQPILGEFGYTRK